jgi:hypothetical protein
MHFDIPPRRPGAYADIIGVDGDPFCSIRALEKSAVRDQRWESIQEGDQGARELCPGRASVAGGGTAGRFFSPSVLSVLTSLDFRCAVGIMRQSRSPLRTGVGLPVFVADSRKEGL